MIEPAAAPSTDPNRRRRAVIRIHEQLIHDLLQLPPDIEVRCISDDPLRSTIDIMVTSPDLPIVDEGACPYGGQLLPFDVNVLSPGAPELATD